MRCVSFSRDLNWKGDVISYVYYKKAYEKLGVLFLKDFFTPPQLFALYRVVVQPCLEMFFNVIRSIIFFTNVIFTYPIFEMQTEDGLNL